MNTERENQAIFYFCSRNTNNHIKNIGIKVKIIDFPVNVAFEM
jgi:hypothetical protein